VLALAGAATLAAQKTTEVHAGRGGSPHVRTVWTIDGAEISIEYGRPYIKGRPETELMPPGKPWRTGADEATTLKTSKMLMFGTVHVPAGTYTLFTVPGEKDWQLIISKQTGQWGTQYSPDQDLARVPMTIGKTQAPVEQLMISIDDTPQGAVLRVVWGTARATVAFSVM